MPSGVGVQLPPLAPFFADSVSESTGGFNSVSVPVNELNDRRAVFKSMSMCYSGLDDNLHFASQCPVSLLQQQRVFLNWNNVI